MSQAETQRSVSTTEQLRRLFRPSHIALVGASEDSRFLRQLMQNNEDLRYAGRISMVNPSHREVFGRPCYPRLSDLPDEPDAVVISVPGAFVPAIVSEGLGLGVRSFVVHAAGFAERGPAGAARQAAIRRECAAAGAVLIGPNCMGALSLADRVSLTGMPLPFDAETGPVGIVAQSGSAATALMNSGRGLRFSYVVSSGNEAVTTTEDLIEFLVKDDSTRMILAFTEGFRQPRRLVEVGQKALAAGKPVIVLKTGMTARGSTIARSHSGALAGSPQAHLAAFERAGIIKVDDFDEMVETAVLLSEVPDPPAQSRLAVFTNSGGETSLTADLAETAGVVIASYSEHTAATLHETFEIDDGVQATNPMDSGMGQGSKLSFTERFGIALELFDADPGIDVIGFGIDLNRRTAPAAGAVDGLAVLKRAAAKGRKVFLVISHVTSGGLDEPLVASLRGTGIPALVGTRQALLAIRHLGEYGQAVRAVRGAEPAVGRDRARALKVLPARQPGAVLGELSLQAALDEYGIPRAEAAFAASADDAVSIADRIGYPVVLKIVSPDVAHKSRVGGVRAGIADASGVASAYAAILSAVTQACPQAHLDGVLVARQHPASQEFLLGARLDRDFGPVIVFGRGGLHVEETRIFTTSLAPLSPGEARELCHRIITPDLLAALGSSAEERFSEIVQCVVNFAQLAADAEGLYDEIEINPLVVTAGQVLALDARIVMLELPSADLYRPSNRPSNPRGVRRDGYCLHHRPHAARRPGASTPRSARLGCAGPYLYRPEWLQPTVVRAVRRLSEEPVPRLARIFFSLR
jgi:acetate---CoA ligase (ADP-forming)